MGVALTWYGVGYGPAAAQGPADTAWQSRPYHLRSGARRGESPAVGEERTLTRRPLLNWKTPRDARLLTRATPRPDADDPFNDPFGDRQPSALIRPPKPATPTLPIAASPGGSARNDMEAATPSPGQVAGARSSSPQPAVELASAESVTASHLPSPFVIDPSSEPTLADPRERPAAAVVPESPRRVPAEGRSATRPGRRSLPAPEASVSSETVASRAVRRANVPPQSSASSAKTSPNRASASNRDLPPLLVFAAGQSGKRIATSRRREFRITDPSQQRVTTVQFEETPRPDEPLSPGPQGESEALDDLFAPAEQPEPETRGGQSPDTPELGEDADFNRPFATPQDEPPTEEDPSLLPRPEEAQLPAPRDADQPGTSDREIERDLEGVLGDDYALEKERPESSCERTYNDRNCCEEEELCASYITRLRSKAIQQIDLDVSPPYMPLATGDGRQPTGVEGVREKIPSRVWKDRRGRAVAEGKMYDWENGRVIVRDEKGTLIPLPWLEMSRDDQCFATAWWELPVHCAPGDEPAPIRDFALTTMTWTASALCHKPLYFQDVQLERYGHSAGPLVQPFLSGAHFFSSLALLPYNMGMYPPGECRYALGYYRPNSCAPWMISAFPISKRGAISEAAFIAGMFGIFH